MIDFHSYVGIPFEAEGRDRSGCDCYGLVHLVYRERFGIELPALGDAYSDAFARGEIDSLARRELAGDVYDIVTKRPRRPADILVFRIGPYRAHVGLWVKPRHMLHILPGAGSCLVRCDLGGWDQRLACAVRPKGAPHGE